MRKKNSKKAWEHIPTLLVGSVILILLLIAFYIRNEGYRKGQIDWQKGKKCVVLKETDSGEKILILVTS